MKKLTNKQYISNSKDILNYYELENDKPLLLILHAQATNSTSFFKLVKMLHKNYHFILIDYYGHGKSSKNKKKYNLISLGNDIIEFINNRFKDKKINILGHSCGGLIASYIASKLNNVNSLIIEDSPFFASLGDNRFKTFNYLDLSSISYNFTKQNEIDDFVYYYFMNQYAWKLFPIEYRDKIRNSLSKFVKKYRIKHPNKMLKVPFWPKKFLEVFRGLEEYDPYFGISFYDDSFNKNIDYEKLLTNIKCNTLFLKAKTTIDEHGTILGALTDEQLNKVKSLVKRIEIKYFDCGHGIHTELLKPYCKCIDEFLKINN